MYGPGRSASRDWRQPYTVSMLFGFRVCCFVE
jgi:hypothetical protein